MLPRPFVLFSFDPVLVLLQFNPVLYKYRQYMHLSMFFSVSAGFLFALSLYALYLGYFRGQLLISLCPE